jgi:hypothetical protein
MFEAGDLVKCIQGGYKDYPGEIGKIYEVSGEHEKSLSLVGYEHFGCNPTRFVLHKKKGEVMQYEDKWHLNDGSVDIPDNAEKLMNPEGTSVVAFRKPVEEVVYTRWIVHCDRDFNSFFNKKYAESTGRPVAEVKYTFRGDKLVKVQTVD